MDWALIWRSLPDLAQGALTTLVLTTTSIGLGLVLGTVVGLMRLSRMPVAGAFAGGYVWFFRGTPLLVQIMLIYYALPHLGLSLDRWQAGVTALSLNSAAYIAEIVRAGVQSIDAGQTEAAWALGLTRFQTVRFVILPQAFRRIVPPLGNEFILLLKDSSLVSVIALEELLRRGQLIVTRTFKPIEIYAIVALFYLIQTTLISWLVAYTERQLRIQARPQTPRAGRAGVAAPPGELV
ncbi:MAG: amino acid ABC transporter permease [Firmicutes bacterium]|nr:amino acid ABC transporter permease [Bacillota bacterium]